MARACAVGSVPRYPASILPGYGSPPDRYPAGIADGPTGSRRRAGDRPPRSLARRSHRPLRRRRGRRAHMARRHRAQIAACVMLSATRPTADFGQRPLQLLAQPLRVAAVRTVLAPGVRRLYAIEASPLPHRRRTRLRAAGRGGVRLLRAPRQPGRNARPDPGRVGARRPRHLAGDLRAPAECVPAGPELEFAERGRDVQRRHTPPRSAMPSPIRRLIRHLALGVQRALVAAWPFDRSTGESYAQ